MIKASLSDLANITMGTSPAGEFCGAEIIGIPLLNGPAEFTDFYPVPVQFTSAPKRLSKPGDILFCVRGSTTGRMNWSDQEYAIGRGLAAISHKSGSEYNHFLRYLLENNLNSLLNNTNGSTFPNLTSDLLAGFIITIPDLGGQKKISAVLKSVDTKIAINNRINAELEDMAKTLYDYWFVQFNFPDANGKPYKTSGGKMVYNPTLKRKIPEGWQVKKLAKITSLIRRGISPKYTETGGFSVLNQKCIRDQKISFEDSRRHQLELSDEDERLLRLFDVVINSTGVGTLGRVAYVKRLLETKTTVDSHVTIVRANDALVSPQYLAWEMMRYQPLIEAAANGSTGQVELNKSFLEDIDIIVPEDLITQKFIEFIEPIVPVLAKRESENEYLVSLRNWLLPMLMNGQVTVT